MIYKIQSNIEQIRNSPLFIDIIPDRKFKCHYEYRPRSSVGVTFLFLSACGLSKRVHVPFAKLTNEYNFEWVIADFRQYMASTDFYNKYSFLSKLLNRACRYGEFNDQMKSFFQLDFPMELSLAPWNREWYPLL